MQGWRLGFLGIETIPSWLTEFEVEQKCIGARARPGNAQAQIQAIVQFDRKFAHVRSLILTSARLSNKPCMQCFDIATQSSAILVVIAEHMIRDL